MNLFELDYEQVAYYFHSTTKKLSRANITELFSIKSHAHELVFVVQAMA